jgi:hypothetical protein
MNTSVRLNREIMKRPWYSDLNMRGLFLHALVVANSSGSFTAGRAELAEATGISEQSIRTAMKKLMDFGELTISTTNKYSVITVSNYADFACSCEGANQHFDAPTSTVSTTWRDNFEQYIAEAEPEWDRLHDDWEWIEAKKTFYPGVCIQRSLQKMWEEYWGTEEGWKQKKRLKSKTTNWKSTIEKGLSMKFNRVYFARDERDYEADIIADIRRKRESTTVAQRDLFGG